MMTIITINDLTAEQVRAILSYDPETGAFTWRARPSVRAGRRAGRVVPDGYVKIEHDGRSYFAHRLAWLYVYGDWPEAYVDHINGIRSDNRICNLRKANLSQNNAHRRGAECNGGLRGASFHKSVGRWRARIRNGGKEIELGYFDTAEEAHAAYRNASLKLHGEFSVFDAALQSHSEREA
jgi:hypothetical protein